MQVKKESLDAAKALYEMECHLAHLEGRPRPFAPWEAPGEPPELESAPWPASTRPPHSAFFYPPRVGPHASDENRCTGLRIGGTTMGLPGWCTVEPWEVQRYTGLAREVRRQLMSHCNSLNVLVAAIQAGILEPSAHKGIAAMYSGHFMAVMLDSELGAEVCARVSFVLPSCLDSLDPPLKSSNNLISLP